jgi:broad specificity phosphatase PhoE
MRLDGRYVEICVDWAFMVPVAERAAEPRHIAERLYHYESSGLGKAEAKGEREKAIGRLMARHHPGGLARASSGLLDRESIMGCDWTGRRGILFLRHADRPSLKGLGRAASLVEITEKGRAEARQLAAALSLTDTIVSSPVVRAMQTAHEMMGIWSHPAEGLRTFSSLARLSRDGDMARSAYTSHKQRLQGWLPLVDAWLDATWSDPQAVVESHQSAFGALLDLTAADGLSLSRFNVAVSHDFYLFALLEALHGRRRWGAHGVPTLSGVFVDTDDARRLIAAYAS